MSDREFGCYSLKGAGQVYFVQAENGGPIKIGFTTDMESRLVSLQTASPYKLKIICSVDSSRLLETYLHKKFKKYRISGEWFSDAPEIREEIKRLISGDIPAPSNSYVRNPEDSYTRLYPSGMKILCQIGLSGAENTVWFALMTFGLEYGSGLIIHENNTPVRGVHIIQKTTLSEKTCYAALRSLEAKGLIARERKGRNYVYFMNPFIMERGNEISIELFSRFQDTVFAQAAVSRIIKKKRKE